MIPRPPVPPDFDKHASQPTDFEGAALLVAAGMVKLLVARHRKYGPANIARHGEKGCVVRMGDKLSRLERAYDLTPTCWNCGESYGGAMAPLAEGETFGDDSLEDAWLDGGNYPIIALMVRRGWWHLPPRGAEPPPAEPDHLEPEHEEFRLGGIIGLSVGRAAIILVTLAYVLLVLR